jgi:hypothetical protein
MRDEWEGSAIRNSGMICNGIFPLYTVSGDDLEDSENRLVIIIPFHLIYFFLCRYRGVIKMFWMYIANRWSRIPQNLVSNSFPSSCQPSQWKLIAHIIRLTCEGLILSCITPSKSTSRNDSATNYVSPIALDLPILGSKETHLKLLPHYLAMLHHILTDKVHLNNAGSSSSASRSQTRGCGFL